MFQNKEGQRVPEVTFRTRSDNDWQNLTTSDLFAGKTVIVFSLPGAFTPTCSSSHVPRFNQLAPVFRKHGVDDIVCMSVNDAFVMNEWKKDQAAENVTTVYDLWATVLHQLGVNHEKLTYRYGGRDFRLTDVHGNVLHDILA